MHCFKRQENLGRIRAILHPSHLSAAMLNDSLHLLVHELHATQARLFETTYLTFHEQLKGHLGNEECWPRALRKEDTLRATEHTDGFPSSIL